MAFYPLQTQKFKLSGNGIGTTDTSLTLVSFQMPDGTNITTADIGAIGYMTLEPGTSREEQISFTTVTQNGDGTATLSGVTRGLAFDSTYAATAGLRQAHAGGTVAILSNTSGFYNEFAIKQNDETITGAWTFDADALPKADTSTAIATSAGEFITKYHFDTNGGNTSNFDQTLIAGNAGETVAAGEVVYLSESDGEWYKADASASSTSENLPLGIAQGAGTDGNAISGGVLVGGMDKNATYTAGAKYYVSDTAGALSTSPGTVEVYVGHGEGKDNYLVWQHNVTLETITAAEKDALVGTSGTPSSSNKYVTNDDTSDDGTASKVVRYDASSQIDVASTPTAATHATSKSYVDTNRAEFLYTIDSVSPTNNTSENTVFSTTIDANTLGTSGGIFIKIPITTGTSDSTAVTYTLRLKLGGSTVATANIVSPNIFGGSGGASVGYVEAFIQADGATNDQDVFIGGVLAPFGVLAMNKVFPYFSAVQTTTSAVDMTSSQTLSITQQKSAATTFGSETYGLGHVVVIKG